jgi:G3E family GTPase
VRTVRLRLRDQPLDHDRVRAWLEALLWRDAGGAPPPLPSSARGGNDGDGDGDNGGNGDGEQQEPPEVLRLKGVLELAGPAAAGRPALVQGVGETYELVAGERDAPPWADVLAAWRRAEAGAAADATAEPAGAEGARESRLVLIGRRLDERALLKGLEACRVVASTGS